MQLIGFVGVVSPICFLLLTHFGLGEAGFPFLFGVPTLTKILKKLLERLILGFMPKQTYKLYINRKLIVHKI